MTEIEIGSNLRNTIINIAIIAVVAVAVYVTNDMNALWGLLALFIVN
jgi:hypothetical protein